MTDSDEKLAKFKLLSVGLLTASVVPFVQQLDIQESVLRAPEWLPYREQIESASVKITAKIGELVGSLAGYLVSAADLHWSGCRALST